MKFTIKPLGQWRPGIPKAGPIGAGLDSVIDLATLNAIFRTPAYYVATPQKVFGTCCEERQALNLPTDELHYPLVYACPSGPALLALAGMLLACPIHYEAGMSRADHTASVLWHMRQANPSSVFYAHTDDTGHGCGCAGIELGKAMLGFLLEYPDLLPEIHRKELMQRIETVLSGTYFDHPGSSVLETLWNRKLALKRTVTGAHPAQVVVLNHHPRLLDRNLVKQTYPTVSLLAIDLSAVEQSAIAATDDVRDAMLLKQIVRPLIEAFVCLACSDKLFVAELF